MNKISPKRKKFTYKALVTVALQKKKKKIQEFLLFFLTLSPFSRLFLGSGKFLIKFQDFLQTLRFVKVFQSMKLVAHVQACTPP